MPGPVAPTRDRPALLDALSPGVWVVALLALVASVVLVVNPERAPEGKAMWTFSPVHAELYDPIVAEWNQGRTPRVNMTVINIPAMEQRLLSAFLAQTRSADLIEAERRIAARAFTGPLDAVGFVDLTDRLREEGLMEGINAPSFTPWTTRGRIFGLPHDMHPVMLAYRADIIEAAGIDLTTVKTWEEFIAALRPLMADADGNGEPDHYMLNFWPSNIDLLEVFILQAGGSFFDEAGAPVVDSEVNARVLATLASWCAGSGRICADAPEFSASGNRLLLEGYVLAALMPDWMCNIWKKEIPQLAGKVKLMPMPAWEAGGLRTSVRGGTMLGFAKTADDFDGLWAFARHLYLSRDLARDLYHRGDIVTPVKALWDDPVFDEPDPYFCGQRKGRMFLSLAPSIPVRSSSPYNRLAQLRTQDALVSLWEYARARGGESRPEPLMDESRRLLAGAQEAVRRELDRNVFLREGGER